MRKIVLYLWIFFATMACSVKKDKFLNRNFHVLVTKYNILFNGHTAFEKGEKLVKEKYYDDFSKTLPVESFSFYANETTTSENGEVIGLADFDAAEKKAVKAIQKHSMDINGVEKNYQIDESYLLLGKARYYTKRFGPALEAFEFITKNYPTASLIYETVIWRAKANVHIGNVDFAIRSIDKLLEVKSLSPHEKQQAVLTMAMAYEKKEIALAKKIDNLWLAVNALPKGQDAARALFIIGQLYREKGEIDKSDEAFKQVINTKNALYKFKLQAKLELINNHLVSDFLQRDLAIQKLMRKSANLPYIDKLYYTRGVLYQVNDSIEQSNHFFTKAVSVAKNDVYQKSLSYECLGDNSLKEKKYKTAKAYYDSILAIFPDNKSPRMIGLRKKSNGLAKVVSTMNKVAAKDSILYIASLNEKELIDYFNQYIASLKEIDRLKREKEQLALQKLSNANFAAPNTWYFYNAKVRVEGKRNFMTLWKASRHDEKWYAASLFVNSISDSSKNLTKVIEDQKLTKYDIDYYLQKVNKKPTYLDSIQRQRDLDYYELGNAYYDQLAEPKLATNKLEQLLLNKPYDDLKIGTYYRLWKINNEIGNKSKAMLYQQKLNAEFPSASFTHLVNKNNDGNNAIVEDADWTPEKCYEAVYGLYKVFANQEALEEVKQAVEIYKGTYLAPKFDLLYAYILARTEGKDAFYKMLKQIQYQYPNTEEATKASELLKNK